MTTIKATTKQAQGFIKSYNRATATTLNDVYGSYSTAKARAFRYCMERVEKENGNRPRIISSNCNVFTFAFLVDNGLRVETAQNSYFIPFES